MKPDVVAMVVGGALGGVVAVVATGWCFCRRLRRRGRDTEKASVAASEEEGQSRAGEEFSFRYLVTGPVAGDQSGHIDLIVTSEGERWETTP
jgi:hypothetical protein